MIFMKPRKTVVATRARLLSLRARLDAWAIAIGRERRTLARTLRRNGVEVVPGKLYGVKEILDGMLGAQEIEKIRNLKLDADEKERRAKIEEGKLLYWEDAEKIINEKIVSPYVTLRDAQTDPRVREVFEQLDRILRASVA